MRAMHVFKEREDDNKQMGALICSRETFPGLLDNS